MVMLAVCGQYAGFMIRFDCVILIRYILISMSRKSGFRKLCFCSAELI